MLQTGTQDSDLLTLGFWIKPRWGLVVGRGCTNCRAEQKPAILSGMATEEPKAPELGRWQFSLRTLFVAVVFVAIGSFALSNAENLWVRIVSVGYTTLVILYAASLGSRMPGRKGRFAASFAIAGLSTASGLGMLTLWLATLNIHYISIGGDEIDKPFNYLIVSYCLLTLFVAYICGLIASHFYSTRTDES